jgi:hypothetical protein
MILPSPTIVGIGLSSRVDRSQGVRPAELGLRDDDDCYAEFSIDSQHYKRYGNRALQRIRDALPTLDVDAVWEAHKPRRKR